MDRVCKSNRKSGGEVKEYEMAKKDDVNSIVLATQISFVKMLKSFINDFKKEAKIPGLTWEQLDFLLDEAVKRTPEIIVQENEI